MIRVNLVYIMPATADKPAQGNLSDQPLDGAGMDAPASPYSLKTFATGKAHLEHIRQVKDWVRTRFSLTDEDTSMVSEVACRLPGCPPVETVIAFWTENGEKRHHYKIFKPVAEVTEDDLPPYWMKNALVVDSDFYCSCC
jgi:hypothetical protein